MPEENIIALSRSGTAVAKYTERGGKRSFPDLYEAITAGSLQRIATSMESIAGTLTRIETNMDKPLGTFELQKQVTKLSMRLKTAGLDGDPYSDNRGKRKNGPG